MNYDWIGFVVVFVVGFFLTLGPVSGWFPRSLSVVLAAGMFMRAVGSIVRYLVLYGYYSGGDATRYYQSGIYYAREIWQLSFSFLSPPYWGGRWWGTQTVMFISGFVISIVGPSQPGAFLFFSIVAFFALVLFVKTFQKNYPESGLKEYALWLFLWPSLCFWPSSIGKDSPVLFATGLVVYGYAAKVNRISWIPLALGLALASAIRPHVAGVMVVSIALAHWVSPTKKWNSGHFIQGIFILIVLSLVLSQGMSNLGIESMDLDDFKDYVNTVSARTSEGGSAIVTPGIGFTSVPLAVVNVLFRPFPWEAGNILSAAASAEMVLFWALVIFRRRRVAALAAQWRSTRLLRLVVPLTILYVLMLGIAVGNLGILVRQRIQVMPLLLIWLEAKPLTESLRQNVTGLRRVFSRTAIVQRTPVR